MPKFVPRQRKQKVLRRQNKHIGNDGFDGADTNAAEILPAEGAEREKRKNEMKAAIKAGQPSMSSKKKKRLDKYIDKKLRKEENLDLIKKLADRKVDTGLLKSSRSLGVVRPSKREVFSRALNEAQAGINVEKNQEILFEPQDTRSDDSSVESGSESSTELLHKQGPDSNNVAGATYGSGLKRPLEVGSDGQPNITKKKRRKLVNRFSMPGDDSNGSWDGFSETETGKASSSAESQSDSGTDSGSESEASDDSQMDERTKARSSAFKAWATSQVNEAVGFTPSSTVTQQAVIDRSDTRPTTLNHNPRPQEVEPLPPELSMASKDLDRKASSIALARPDEVQAHRMELPIAGEEQRIMEAVYNNTTVIICGETGSGKTTQVPQFLYEAGFGHENGPNPGMIGITQPRRVAAVSMATRVANELSGTHVQKVAHQIRYDSSVSKNTSIKFMTDGILLREIASDFPLSRYSVIIVDEAHERSLNTDILIGLLSRIVDLRENMSKEAAKPLKLIIMSATLRVQDFLNNKMLFRNGSPPLVQVEGRQYPVTMHFARRTQSDYADQTFQKVCRGHRMLPPGGMLVFLTAQDEVNTMVKRLQERLSNTDDDDSLSQHSSEEAKSDGNEDNDEDEQKDFEVHDFTPSSKTPAVLVLPLYSQLQTNDQLRVFEPPPEGSRLIVVATNVAETSITIPGIRYVFDCGRVKERQYDTSSGVQSFEVGWISKAAASQRAGRAGRTGPGHCYKLYSSAVYERDFEEHAEPEILRTPVEGVLLQLKNMELHNVVNFPFPSPPDRQGLARAEKLLTYLGALSKDGRVTPTGRDLTAYPISPRYAKMLAVGHQFKCMAFTIVLVAALATPNLFISDHQLGLRGVANDQPDYAEDSAEEEARTQRKTAYNSAHRSCSKLSRTSDGLKAFTALQGYMKTNDKPQYCSDMFLSPKPAHEASRLADQLFSIILNHAPLHLSTSNSSQSSPSKDQVAALQQFTAAGFIDQIAILASEAPSPPYLGRSPKRAIDVPYLPLFPISKERLNADSDIRDIAAYVHPSSVLAHLPVKEMPKYVIYSHLQRGQQASIEGSKKPKTRMHALTTVSERTMIAFTQGTPLLEFGKPLSILEEKVGEKGKTRTCIVQPSLLGEKGTMGWSMPAQKVVQIRSAKGEWNIE